MSDLFPESINPRNLDNYTIKKPVARLSFLDPVTAKRIARATKHINNLPPGFDISDTNSEQTNTNT